MSSTPSTLEDQMALLVIANHILHHHKVLDGFGHISLRHPTKKTTFFTTGVPAALIDSSTPYYEINISDGQRTDGGSIPSTYSEHYVHAAMLAKYPEVNSVVHSHAPAVLPFAISPKVPLKACLHTAAFLGPQVPVWDISDAYTTQETKARHLLVNDYSLGASLAEATNKTAGPLAFHKVVVQRGHGFTCVGDSIEEAVYNAIYTIENALVQSSAHQLHGDGGGKVHGLSEAEIAACAPMDRHCIGKVWPLWVKEVEKAELWS
ncbi:hypothetical protein LTR86_010482 [Recurvomyces mirabilis]|nr:hypothetical protein LTR86_010482 [Recurvomyces mirabilis]